MNAATDLSSSATPDDVYQQLGLATAADRASFLLGSPAPVPAAFDVVISTSSQPFAS